MDYVFTSPQRPASAAPQTTTLSFPTSNLSTSLPEPPPSLPSDSPDLSSLRSAAQLIDRELAYDEQRPVGLDQLETRDHGHYHYDKSPQFTLTRQITLPQSLLDQYDTVECQSYAGLLPAIHRAYLTIDNRLYLFNYNDPSKFYAYTDLQQIIISVTLLTPKPNIFTSTIPYLLCLTTPVEIHLLAITLTTTDELTLYPTQFSIPSDGISILDVTSTRSGRTFMAGKDGHLYELDYQARDGWFRRKMRKVRVSSTTSLPIPIPAFIWPSSVDPLEKVVVDESRSPALLYTLSSSSVITVYSYAGEGGVKLLSMHRSVFEEAKQLLYNLHPNSTEDWAQPSSFSLTSIHPIPRTESERLTLVATTTHGHRLFFTLYDNFYSPALHVKLVRLSPPGRVEPEGAGWQRGEAAFDPAWRKGSSPEGVHYVMSKGGVVMMADGIVNEGDHLLCFNREFTPSSNKLIEKVEVHTLPSKVADLAETPSPASTSPLASSMYARGQDVPLVGLSEFACQHVVGQRR